MREQHAWWIRLKLILLSSSTSPSGARWTFMQRACFLQAERRRVAKEWIWVSLPDTQGLCPRRISNWSLVTVDPTGRAGVTDPYTLLS